MTYPGEVKSTRGWLEETLYVSNSRMNWARALSVASLSEHLYIALAVYDVDFQNTLTAELMRYVGSCRIVFDGPLCLGTSNCFGLTPSSMVSAIPFRRYHSQ